jgi:hypothetical protein
MTDLSILTRLGNDISFNSQIFMEIDFHNERFLSTWYCPTHARVMPWTSMWHWSDLFFCETTSQIMKGHRNKVDETMQSLVGWNLHQELQLSQVFRKMGNSQGVCLKIHDG